MKGNAFEANRISKNIPGNLYVLKHKDLDVAMVEIDGFTGKIEYVLDIYIFRKNFRLGVMRIRKA